MAARGWGKDPERPSEGWDTEWTHRYEECVWNGQMGMENGHAMPTWGMAKATCG